MPNSPRVIELREYAGFAMPEPALLEVEAMLLDEKYGAQIQVEPPSFRNGRQWQLTSLGWVGYIPLTSELGFRLTPKVPLGNLFGMWEYAYRLNSFRFLADLIECHTLEDFFEQLASILAKRVLDRARKGYYRSYLSENERLPYVRGRIDMRHATRSSWDVRIDCHYEEHTADIEDNQLLTYTLWRIARSGVCRERVLPSIRNAYRSLQGLTSLQPFGPAQCVGRSYNRLNQDYQPLHALSRFFLEQTGPTHEMGDRQIMPFLVDMASLFELFVAEWLRIHLPHPYSIKLQEAYHIGDVAKYSIDLVIYNSVTEAVAYVLDTKYKAPESPSTSDIQQVQAYAHSMGSRDAVLVYPVALSKPLNQQVRDIKLRTLTFSLDGNLEENGQAFLGQLLGASVR